MLCIIYIYTFAISVDISGIRVLNALIRQGRAMISYQNYPKIQICYLKFQAMNDENRFGLKIFLENHHSWRENLSSKLVNFA